MSEEGREKRDVKKTKKNYPQKNSTSFVHRSTSLVNKRILITCGPTWVALDDVRVISNRSTGEMGHLLAKSLKTAKAKVTLLEGPVTDVSKLKGITVHKYCFFEELKDLLNRELKRGYDCVIHAAAVSDFGPEKKFTGKIRSGSSLTLRLSPLPKLINKIKTIKPKIFLVGFKLESFNRGKSSFRGTQKLFRQGRCDLVVANFTTPGGYEALVLDAEQSLLGKVKNKKDLVHHLVGILKERL